MQPRAFSDRVGIVTGAGKGIGQATAIAFSQLGAKVVLSGRSEEPLMHTLALIERSGGTAAIVIGDVSNESFAEATVAMALKEFGRLDFAVNNAGISPWTGNTVECGFESWQRVISVNLTGTWLGMKHQIPGMLKAGGGAIINMTSVAALQVFEVIPHIQPASGVSWASQRWLQRSLPPPVSASTLSPRVRSTRPCSAMSSTLRRIRELTTSIKRR